MVPKLKSLVRKTPILGDAIGFYRDFKCVQTSVRGVYPTYEAALTAIPKGYPVGYDQTDLIMASDDVAKFTAAKNLGDHDDRDKMVIEALRAALPQSSSVFNVGGNVGIEYYAYKSFLPEISKVDWTVCEIPSLVERGLKIARERGERKLHFTTDIVSGDSSDIFLCVGTAQYLAQSLEKTIGKYKKKPDHIIISNSPAVNGEEFYTIQNIGYAFVPYHVFSLSKVENDFKDLGYSLKQRWSTLRSFSVPFAPRHKVEDYYGFYFTISA